MRQTPNSLEAERSVLGGMLISKHAVNEALSHLDEHDFYQSNHQLIFHAIGIVSQKNIPIDLTTITNQLSDLQQLDQVGGIEYLVELSGYVPTTANIKYYIDIIKEKSVLRSLIDKAGNIIDQAYDEVEDVAAYIEEAEKQILEITRNQHTGEFRTVKDVVQSVWEKTQELMGASTNITGLKTGFHDLDAMTSGFQRGDLIILAARPSVGKTAFALNVGQRVAKLNDASVAIFSLEMPAEQLVTRMLSSVGRLEGQRLKTGDVKDEVTWNKYLAACSELRSYRMFIDDSPSVKIGEIHAKCRKLKQEQGLDLVIIDYLQLINGNGKSKENRQQEVSEISRSLKALAREMEVPVIALSQLSRSVEQRQDKRPMMSDLRESGAIEQDADLVAFLYRDEYYDREKQTQEASEVEVILGKHRNGPTGTVTLMFEKKCNAFLNIAHTQG